MFGTSWQADHRLFHFLNQTIANPVFDLACPVIRDKWFLVCCYFILVFWVYRMYPGQLFKIILFGAITFLLTDQISSSLIKPFFHRLRPCNDPSVGSRLLLQYCGSGFSFVSGHAANSFGMAAFLSFISLRPGRAAWIFGTWASLVSFSQVYVGIHYPADVLAGGILGIVIGTSGGIILKTKFGLKN